MWILNNVLFVKMEKFKIISSFNIHVLKLPRYLGYPRIMSPVGAESPYACVKKKERIQYMHSQKEASPRWYPSDDDLFNAFIIEAFSCMGSSSIVVVVLLSLLIELLWALWKKSKDPTKRYVHFDLIHNHPSWEFLPILVTMDSLDASTPPLFPISSGLLLVT